MRILRGDIYFVKLHFSTGSEQRGGRPAIVVSGDKNNEHSATVEVVYLTAKKKRNDMPTHVTIRSSERISTALCEQVTTVALERIGYYIGHVTDVELKNLDIAMMISLGVQIGITEKKIREVVR